MPIARSLYEGAHSIPPMQIISRLASRQASLDHAAMISLVGQRRAMSLSSRLDMKAAGKCQRLFVPVAMIRRNQGTTPQRRTIFSMSRLPLKLAYQQHQGQTVQVQKVRFTKPRVKPAAIFTTIIIFLVCYQIYIKVVLEPIEKAATEAFKSMSAAELKELQEEDHKPLFIPFPGTTKQLKPVPYKGSDPEWQEFVRLSKQPTQVQRIKDDLAQLVRQVADRHPVLAMRCGKGMKLRRSWLDIDFPFAAPPEFERSGLELHDDYIGWGTQKVDSITVFRLQKALWPTALLESFWSFTKVMVLDDSKRIARFLGISSSPPPLSMEQVIAAHQKAAQITGGTTKLPNKSGPPDEDSNLTPDPAKALQQAANASSKTMTANGSFSKTPEEDDPNASFAKKAALHFTAHFGRPIMAFRQKFAQTWKPTRDYPPRGCVIISGMVEVDAPRAWLVFDVKAAWDPKTRGFDMRSLVIQLRRYQLKTQSPRS